MRESKVIEEFQKEARSEGRIEGHIEASIEANRKFVLEALEVKFGPRAVAEFAPILQNVTDFERLARLPRIALQASTLKQFRDRFSKLDS